MPDPEAPFDIASRSFREYENTVVGQLRYTLARENLLPYLPEVPAKILDACGGSGPDTLWLAGLGYDVHLVDPSPDQIGLACQRFAEFGSPVVNKRLKVTQSFIEDLPADFSEYDAALSHVVGSYMKSPYEYWKEVVQRVRPGGVLSILENGTIGGRKMLRARGDAAEQKKFEATGWYTNNVGLEVRTFSFEELSDIMRSIGMRVMFQAGVRIESAYNQQTVEEYGRGKFNDLVASEQRLALDTVRKHEGSLLHVIAKKFNPL